MDIKKDGILEFHPDTVEAVRKELNLDKPGRVDEAVDLLEDWVKMQKHFVRKDFPRIYLETTLITAKGLVERAKQRIDKLCTFKTLMPDFYPNTITRDFFVELQHIGYQAHLPKLTKEHYRVYLLKINYDNFESAFLQTYYKYLVTASEYLKKNDYSAGFVIILDCRHINVLNLVTKISPMDLRHIMTLMTEGYGMRIKSIHVICTSKMVDSLVLLLKQTLSTKVGERIILHKNLDTLHKVIDKDIMPEDFGGKEMSLKELNDKWLDVLCSKNHVEFIQEMNKARTDESCRQADVFNDNYLGMPGSFRALSVD